MKKYAVENPKYEPTNREGAKLPPLPPAPKVIPVAKTLNNKVKVMKPKIIHLLESNFSTRVFSNNFSGWLAAKSFMPSYPSPNKQGNIKINIPKIKAPNSAFR